MEIVSFKPSTIKKIKEYNEQKQREKMEKIKDVCIWIEGDKNNGTKNKRDYSKK